MFRYFWKKLTDDGLLKEPEDVGYEYNRESVNDAGGFESEAEAVEKYERLNRDHSYIPYELALIKVYRPEQ